MIRNDGIPTEPGWYWYASGSDLDIVEVRKLPSGQIYACGYGPESLEDIGVIWQRVKPYDDESAALKPPQLTLSQWLDQWDAEVGSGQSRITHDEAVRRYKRYLREYR